MDFSIMEWVTLFSVSAFLALIGWAYNLSRDFAVSESEARNMRTSIDKLEDSGNDCETRITRVEDGVANLKEGPHKLENKLDMICDKLDALPRLEALLNQFSIVAPEHRPENRD
jgi:chromosome segregation ATPase